MSYYYGNTKNILSNCIDLKKLAETKPELFSFGYLTSNEKMYILREIPVLAKEMKFSGITEKIMAIEFLGTAAGAHIKFTQREKDSLSDTQWGRLMKKDPKRFFNVDQYKAMGVRARAELFSQMPKKIMDAGQPIPEKLTSGNVYTMITDHSWMFTDDHITDFSKYSMTSGMWKKLIKMNEHKFLPKFIEYASSCSTPTDLRDVVRAYPEIIKMLTVDNIAKSKLTVKQWALFIASMLTNSREPLGDWEMDDELREVMMLDLTAEMLTGKSRQSKQLQTAINKLKKKVKQEEQDDEENDDEEPSEEVQPE